MNSKRLISTALLVLLFVCTLFTVSCEKAGGEEITLYVYNWGEYISDGSEDSLDVNRAFEEYCRDTLGLNVVVNYSTYSSNEDLYAGDLARKVIEFSKICAVMARNYDFDVVHAHDWMTYLAGVEVKKATGKPLVVHLHASQFDRAGAEARGWIYDIEKYGMESEAFCLKMLKEGLIGLIPGIYFGTEGYIRLSYCYSDEDLKEGLDRIEKFIKTLE